MPGLTQYHGLDVLDPDPPEGPTTDGGRAINLNMKALVDWNPKSNWIATVRPTKDNDKTENYRIGSSWFAPKFGLYICIDAEEGAAVWRGANAGEIGLTASAMTTNRSRTLLKLGGSDPIVVPTNTTWAFAITTVARRTDTGSNSAVWESMGVIKRLTTSASIVGTISTTTWSDAGLGWTLTIEAGGTNSDELRLVAVGANGQSITWIANVRIVPLTV